jgi:crotonobetainyl-CoA:carnitine CoA-transferase CaiB-like acyl-CoA transferase
MPMTQSSALDGVRVLDLTSVLFGPLCAQNLGDMGADVIKIEAPSGDTTRRTGPHQSQDMSALFLGANRNKRSIVLDLKQESAQEALWRLIDTADVFLHSVRPQKLARLGFSPQAVRKRNPKIIYCGLHGFGEAGPLAGQPAYDDVIQGRSGAAALMRELVGEPRYFPGIVADKTCSLVATYAITTALYARERTGEGQYVEVPMFESMTAFNMAEHLYGETFVPAKGSIGYPRVLAPWRRPYATADGFVCMLAYTDVQWQSFWTEVGRPELIEDARFISLGERTTHVAILYQLAGECMTERSTDAWCVALERLEIPFARVNELKDLLHDEHLDAVNLFQQVEHPTEGTLRMARLPVNFAGTPASIRRLQPRLGQHSEEVLREAGLSEDAITAMLADGASVTLDDS